MKTWPIFQLSCFKMSGFHESITVDMSLNLLSMCIYIYTRAYIAIPILAHGHPTEIYQRLVQKSHVFGSTDSDCGGAWPFLVGGVICLVNSVNERDLNLLNSYM